MLPINVINIDNKRSNEVFGMIDYRDYVLNFSISIRCSPATVFGSVSFWEAVLVYS